MYLIIDNYDSFTYNLYQYFSEITDESFEVIRNDKTSIEKIERMRPAGIVISPGPGRPENAGISVDVIRHFAGKIPILGVCLGHQAIGFAFGAKIVRAGRIVHGKVEEINLDGKGLFRNIPSPARFTRYHSLTIESQSLPEDIEVTAVSQDGEIMGIRHRSLPLEGIQFHPESVASEHGKRLLRNFLKYKRAPFETRALLSGLMDGKNLEFEEARDFMEELTEGDLNNSQIAAFLACLNMKGVVPEEIAGFASVLRMKKTPLPIKGKVLDTCGTGGDSLGTFNISSLAALVASSCGARVAKHGNRGVSSKSGSADFYSSLGIPIDLSPEDAASLLDRTGFTFLFAPLYHGAMKYAAPVRRELGLKTVMNLIGPLSNPANAQYQLIGVFADELCLPVARAAQLLGVERVMVVHGKDGMDEISVSGPTRIVEINGNDEVRDFLFDPQELGIENYTIEELKGGTPDENAEIAMSILSGNGREAVKEAVLLNSGAALYICGLADSIEEGYGQAKEALSKGTVKKALSRIIDEAKKRKR